MAAVGPRRVVINKQRMVGTVTDWSGIRGLITPTIPLTHIEAKKRGGRLYVQQIDLVGLKFLQKGAKVDFIIYSDGNGLGAQEVKLCTGKPASGPQPPKTAPAGKAFSKGGIMQPTAKAQPVKPGGKSMFAANQVKGVKQTINKPQQQLGKFAKGIAQSTQSAGVLAQKKDRQIISQGKVQGKCDKWMGKFGWITADKQIQHPLATRHQGKLYCSKDDLENGLGKLDVGQVVQFVVYADPSGLGAGKVAVVKGKGSAAPAVASAGKGQTTPAAASKGKGKGGNGKWLWVEDSAAQKPAQPAPKPAQPVQKPAQLAQKKQQGKPVWQPLAKIHTGTAGKGTGKAQGKAQGTPGNKGGKGSVLAQKTTAPVQKTIGKPGKGGKQKGGNAAPKAQAPKGPPPNATLKLPANWEEHWSDDHSVPFFWNKITKESRWIKPIK